MLLNLEQQCLTVILKARQLGLSWLVVGWALWLMLFQPAATVLFFSKRDQEAVLLLASGEARTATCRLGPEHLSFVDQDMRRRVEPGVFTIMAGANSRAVLEAQCQVIRG